MLSSLMFSFFARREEGQGLAEYAMILALVAVLVIAIVATLGGHIVDMFTDIASHI